MTERVAWMFVMVEVIGKIEQEIESFNII